jgi:hypothetical protein
VSLTQPQVRGARRLHRGAAAALLIATAPVLAACSAGSDAQSLQVKPNSAATTVSSTLAVNGVTLVTTAGGSAPAALNANISNTGSTAETLRSVTVGGTTATFSGSTGTAVTDLTIPAGGSLVIGGPGNAQADLASLPVQAGQFTPVVFQFASAGSVTLNALVNTGTGVYASYGPQVAPSPSAPAASRSTTAKPTGKAGTTAGATAKTTPTATPTR